MIRIREAIRGCLFFLSRGSIRTSLMEFYWICCCCCCNLWTLSRLLLMQHHQDSHMILMTNICKSWRCCICKRRLCISGDEWTKAHDAEIGISFWPETKKSRFKYRTCCVPKIPPSLIFQRKDLSKWRFAGKTRKP